MRAFCRSGLAALACAGLAFGFACQRRSRIRVTDWNEKAVAFLVARGLPPPQAKRVLAMAHLAMLEH
jgi:hypothetical protein